MRPPSADPALAERYRAQAMSGAATGLATVGRHLATGSDDTTVRLGGLEDGVETAVFRVHSDLVDDSDLRLDGRRPASAPGGRTIDVALAAAPCER